MLRVDCNVQEINEKQEIEHAQHEQFCFLHCLFHFNPFFLVYLFIYFYYLFCSSVEFLVEKERKRIIWFLGRGQNCLQGVFPHRKTLQDVLHCHHLRMALPNPSD